MVQYLDPGPVAFDAVIDAVDYTGSLAPYGGRHLLGVRKDIQTALGKTHGETVHVEVRLDTSRAEVIKQ